MWNSIKFTLDCSSGQQNYNVQQEFFFGKLFFVSTISDTRNVKAHKPSLSNPFLIVLAVGLLRGGLLLGLEKFQLAPQHQHPRHHSHLQHHTGRKHTTPVSSFQLILSSFWYLAINNKFTFCWSFFNVLFNCFFYLFTTIKNFPGFSLGASKSMNLIELFVCARNKDKNSAFEKPESNRQK